MAVPIFFYFYWIFQFFALTLHIFVTSFIILQRNRKNKTYTSPFYLLYIFISFIEMANLINSNFLNRFAYFEILQRWFISHPLYVTICIQISGFCMFAQSIFHFAIAINRAWASMFLMKAGKTTVIGKYGNYIIWFLPILTFLVISPAFAAGTMVYVDFGAGEIFAIYNVTWFRTYNLIAGPTIVLSTSAFSFILTIITMLQYRNALKQINGNDGKMIKREIYLLIHATVTLFFELLVGGYYGAVIISKIYDLPNLLIIASKLSDYIIDISSTVNPIALLIICKFVREDFYEFLLKLFGRKTKVVNISSSSGNHFTYPL